MTPAALMRSLVDFLYPKSEKVLNLESLSSGEMLSRLSPAQDLGHDTIALFAYGDPSVRSIIHELKYRRNDTLAKSLATILMDTLQAELAERALTENFVNPLLIPIPISSKRLRERGWNQTEMLCEEIKKLDTEDIVEYRPSLLRKVSHTESQTHVSKSIRLKNVRDTMEASTEVKGRSVVLLDDVTTTGATFREAKEKLRRSGALKILCIAVAH